MAQSSFSSDVVGTLLAVSRWAMRDLNDDVTLICAWPSDNKDDLTGGVKVRESDLHSSVRFCL
ncbi:hypothetical protein AXX17_AT3G34600 [Arabidopsis thaliana]|uniref:Uncharacterized protein n=1 Tax=Arabidopsis thaliana TaxID=3702 RepID=A0A178V697_ARATH|nr:hypothetical protein AXX17_AT3G34600 [Arabidopsis thaliana]